MGRSLTHMHMCMHTETRSFATHIVFMFRIALRDMITSCNAFLKDLKSYISELKDKP